MNKKDWILQWCGDIDGLTRLWQKDAIKVFTKIRDALTFSPDYVRIEKMLALSEEELREFLAHFRGEQHYAELAPIVEQHLKILELRRAEKQEAMNLKTLSLAGEQDSMNRKNLEMTAQSLSLNRKIYWLTVAGVVLAVLAILIGLLKK